MEFPLYLEKFRTLSEIEIVCGSYYINLDRFLPYQSVENVSLSTTLLYPNNNNYWYGRILRK